MKRMKRVVDIPFDIQDTYDERRDITGLVTDIRETTNNNYIVSVLREGEKRAINVEICYRNTFIRLATAFKINTSGLEDDEIFSKLAVAIRENKVSLLFRTDFNRKVYFIASTRFKIIPSETISTTIEEVLEVDPINRTYYKGSYADLYRLPDGRNLTILVGRNDGSLSLQGFGTVSIDGMQVIVPAVYGNYVHIDSEGSDTRTHRRIVHSTNATGKIEQLAEIVKFIPKSDEIVESLKSIPLDDSAAAIKTLKDNKIIGKKFARILSEELEDFGDGTYFGFLRAWSLSVSQLKPNRQFDHSLRLKTALGTLVPQAEEVAEPEDETILD